jgi:hypothetical protein
MTSITVAPRCFTSYTPSILCYYSSSTSHFFSRGFSFLLHLFVMKDKRGTKLSRSSTSGSSSLPSSVSTPPPSSSGSLPPPVSPPDVSSRRPPSPMYEHGSPNEEIPVVDLSFEEEDAFPSLCGMRCLLSNSSMTSTVGFLGRSVMAMSSSSTTLLKKRRCARRTPLMPKPLHHLLLTPWPQPSLLPMSMMHLKGSKTIIVMVETRSVVLRLPPKRWCLQGACSKEFINNDDFVLLHHKFF